MSSLRAFFPIPLPRLARFLAVVAIAMAAGHLVQSLADRAPVEIAATASVLPQNIIQLSSGSDQAEGTESPPARPIEIFAAASAETEPQVVPTAPIAVAKSCSLDLALDADPAATLGILVLAPCKAGERVVLRHAGLAVTARLDEAGRLDMSLPALVPAARVEVMFSDGQTVEGLLDLPEAANLRRFGIQWQGPEAFVLHGFRDGASDGEPGHISPLNAGNPETGHLMVLGDATVDLPLLAQVYTFPAARQHATEVVIEAAVTEATCGHDMLGEVISSQDGTVEVTDLTLAMPDCSGIGDFLVLKNLASDLKIASR